jgi:hypothetical protein
VSKGAAWQGTFCPGWLHVFLPAASHTTRAPSVTLQGTVLPPTCRGKLINLALPPPESGTGVVPCRSTNGRLMTLRPHNMRGESAVYGAQKAHFKPRFALAIQKAPKL